MLLDFFKNFVGIELVECDAGGFQIALSPQEPRREKRSINCLWLFNRT